MRRMWVVGAAVLVALCADGCSLISPDLAPVDTDRSPSPPPTAATADALGVLVEPVRVEMIGSGFTLDVPEGWMVEMASPDPDVADATPGSAWEALRASTFDGSAACSVFVAVAAEGQQLEQGYTIESSDAIAIPQWEKAGDGSRLLVPQLAVVPAASRSHSTEGLLRARGSHPLLPAEVLYELVCTKNTGAEPPGMPDAFALLPLD